MSSWKGVITHYHCGSHLDGEDPFCSDCRTDRHFNELQDENVRLREALKSLSNEASGLIYAHEFALSMDGGNSNMQVLRIRLEEARAALEGKE